jgi:precorrin-6A/cobalt-precorrin-6A reductase
MVRLLVLGGTGEARELVTLLRDRPDVEVELSLAGGVTPQSVPAEATVPAAGSVRVGAFGGVAGLVRYLRAHKVTAVVDATHPFAETITRHAAEACTQLALPLLVLRRPAWPIDTGWRCVADLERAASLVATMPVSSVFLTIGRSGLSAFTSDAARHYLIRMISAPTEPLPPHSTLLLDRGPFALGAERDLMARHQVEVLVTKNSGGSQTAAKLAAARSLDLPVVVIDRPALPAALDVVDSVADAVGWLGALAATVS